jgi:hypothetical protein
MLSPDRLHRPFGKLLASELHIVGLAISREFALAVGAIVVFCLLSALTAIRYHEQLDALPEILIASFPVALILPWLVWKGDRPFGRAFLWTLPVHRQHAAAAKIIAGAVWLLLAMLIALLVLLATALATGGSIGVQEMRLVGGFDGGFAGATRVPWSTPAWMWLTPFGGALVLYLVASAAIIGLRHPWRWFAGLSVAVALVGVLALNTGPHSALQDSLDHVFNLVVNSSYGADRALSGGIASLSEDTDTGGRHYEALWRALPSARQWAMALCLWLGGALLAVALALRRHWER